MYMITRYYLFFQWEVVHPFLCWSRDQRRERKKIGVLVNDMLLTNKSGLMERDPLISKKRKGSESRKKRMNAHLI